MAEVDSILQVLRLHRTPAYDQRVIGKGHLPLDSYVRHPQVWPDPGRLATRRAQCSRGQLAHL